MTSNVLANVTVFPSRWLLKGPGACLRVNDKGGDPHYRWEMHPNDLCQIIHNYCKPGVLVVDSTAGSLKTAIACLRTGRRCVVFEKEDNLVKEATQRLHQAFNFYQDHELLCAVGDQPVSPRAWELQGLTWQSQWQQDLIEAVRSPIQPTNNTPNHFLLLLLLLGEQGLEEAVQGGEGQRKGTAESSRPS